MTQEEKEIFKKQIQDEIDAVRQELERLKAQDKPYVSDRAHGRMGRIDALQNKGFHDRGMRSLEAKLNGLEKNLMDIDSGEFGVCEYCKGPIGMERLKAAPEAKMCITCAQKFS